VNVMNHDDDDNDNSNHPTKQRQSTTQYLASRHAVGGAQYLPPKTLSHLVAAATLPQADCVAWVVEVIENERYYPLAGWTTKMMPTDPPACSTRSGVPIKSMKDLDVAPRGWIWHGSWVKYTAEYAVDFDKEFSQEQTPIRVVRRTVYRRVMIFRG